MTHIFENECYSIVPFSVDFKFEMIYFILFYKKNKNRTKKKNESQQECI